MDYAEGLRSIVETSPLFAGRRVRIDVIANPVAGGFTIKKKSRANRAALETTVERSRRLPVVAEVVAVSTCFTESAGHAGRIAREVLASASRAEGAAVLFLLVVAGGDGTSHDVQGEFTRFVLDEGHPEIADRVCVLRLPFGTGNDGSDGKTLAESLSLLAGATRFSRQSAVRVSTRGINPSSRYAFNIASIGLDAFVTHMTNRIKNRLPGDFYKLWLDIACLFYNKIYRVGKMSVVARDARGAEIMRHSDTMILYLMGASGHRTYGSSKNILPRDENVCGIKEMSVFRKLTLKRSLETGGHADSPETYMYTAQEMEISYDERIYLQLDGEGILLEAKDFPLVMELTEPFMMILAANN